MMNIAQIKAAVDAGQNVRWSNDGYHVTRDTLGQYGLRALPENQNAKTAPFTPHQQPALMQGFAPVNDAIRCIP
jgi:hypothetical protein